MTHQTVLPFLCSSTKFQELIASKLGLVYLLMGHDLTSPLSNILPGYTFPSLTIQLHDVTCMACGRLRSKQILQASSKSGAPELGDRANWNEWPKTIKKHLDKENLYFVLHDEKV